MERLGPRDLEQVLRFLAEVRSIEQEEPFTREFLATHKGLVDCDWIGYNELDRFGLEGSSTCSA